MKRNIFIALSALLISASISAQNSNNTAGQGVGNPSAGATIQTQSQAGKQTQNQVGNNTAIQAQTRSRIHRQDQLHRQAADRDQLRTRDQLRKRDLSCLSGLARPSATNNIAAGRMMRNGNIRVNRNPGVCRR